jgi:tetratricopeptide (TPR) repeat protein
MRHSLALFLVVMVATLLTAQSAQPASTPAHTSPASDAILQRASELFDSGKYVAAMPLLEQLSADHPQDATIKSRWAVTMMSYAATLSDPNLRKKARARARSIAVEAQKLGDRSPMTQLLLELPLDGSEAVFSPTKEVDTAMKAAEADFVRGDFGKAREGYLRALLLDPNSYEATLFVGDTYFRQHENGSAGEWFARATQIDTNRESAYRYWGDALSAMGNRAGARDEYIAAIIAEPYNQQPWASLARWAQDNKITLNWLRLQDKGKLVQTAAGLKINLDPSFHTEDPMFTPWMVYYGRRLEWSQGKFKQRFPNEPQYRHSLTEEADALRLMVLALKQPNVTSIDPSLAMLMKIDEAGFIEPFVLLNRVDKDIAQDYAPYRDVHRDLIHRYFDEFVVPEMTPQH